MNEILRGRSKNHQMRNTEPKNMERNLEPQIKAKIINTLFEQNLLNLKSTVINEFTVDNFSRRVDLAFVREEQIEAFEIKSEADSLNRLDGQIKKYLEHFDKVTIVAAAKHVESVISKVPKNVGVWEVHEKGIRIKRKGRAKKIKDKHKIIKFMTAVELLKLIRFSAITPENVKRHELEKYAIKLPVDVLRKAAFAAVSKRYKATSKLLLDFAHERSINSEDLYLLSPYQKHIKNKENFDIESFICSLSDIK